MCFLFLKSSLSQKTTKKDCGLTVQQMRSVREHSMPRDSILAVNLLSAPNSLSSDRWQHCDLTYTWLLWSVKGENSFFSNIREMLLLRKANIYFEDDITEKSPLFSKGFYGLFILHFITLFPNDSNLHLLKMRLHFRSSKETAYRAVICVSSDLSISDLQVLVPLKLKSRTVWWKHGWDHEGISDVFISDVSWLLLAYACDSAAQGQSYTFYSSVFYYKNTILLTL